VKLNSVDNNLLPIESEGGPSTLRRRALSSGSNNKPQSLRNRCLSTSEMSTASYQVPVNVSSISIILIFIMLFYLTYFYEIFP
jgi:hypothetical protein